MNRLSSTVTLALGAIVFVSAPAIAQKPTEAQQQALRSNCPADFRKHCAGVPTGGMDALVCLEKNVDALSPGCKSAVEAVDPQTAGPSNAPADASTTEATATPPTDAAPSAAASAPPAATTAPTPPQTIPPSSAPTVSQPKLTLRQELALAAGACAIDFRLFCPNLPVGHGNILFCLEVHGPRLAPACRDALVKAGVPVRQIQ